MRRAAPLLIAALLAAAAPAGASCPRTAAPLPSVATWKAVAGHPLGARAATPAQIDRYLRAVDRSSGRVRTFLAGRSLRGRPLRYAAVSSPQNLARLQRLAADVRAVRDGRAPGSFARSHPAFVWLGGSVHGNEPSGGDADMRELYDLASGRSCATLALLRRVVVFVLPMQNPDGRAAGDRDNAAGFDLNRDWFARTQPETEAKLAALSRFPPMVFADQHEEGGTGFFFPPNADPVHHEVPAAALRAIDGVIAPRLRRAFRAHGYDFLNYDTYDLFFMGYGDTVPSTLFGAAGMTFEKGAASPYPEKTAEHFLAAERTVAAASADRRGLLTRWAGLWRQAERQGASGTLQPNRVVQPRNSVRFPVPGEKVYGYVLRADVHAADAAALAARLAAAGVRVRRIAEDAAVPGLRGYGDSAVGGTVRAGDYYVASAQPAKHWVEAMLGEDPYVPFPYFYDVSSWSNPLLMGLAGGVLTQPLAARSDALAAPAAPASAPAHRFAGGSERAVELAFDLLRAGVAVRRQADGAFAAAGGAATVNAAAARGVPLAPLDALPADGRALALPRVAMLEDVASEEPSAWTRWLLERRYGLTVPTVPAKSPAAALQAADVLVAPGGQSTGSQLSPAALLAIQAWVRAGGTLVGVGTRGLGVAGAAGVTQVTAAPQPQGLQLPGVALRVLLDPGDPVAAGEQPEGFVFNGGDPILQPHGARAVVRYPDASRFFVSGYASGADGLQGTVAATDETAGAGRVVLFAFEPAFRGYTDGTERLLGNALLAPRGGGTGARAASPRLVDPAALALPSPRRDATVQVAAEDEAGLLAAARAAGVPADATLERDLTTVTLRVADAAALDDEQPAWTRRLPDALRAAGVAPLLAIL